MVLIAKIRISATVACTGLRRLINFAEMNAITKSHKLLCMLAPFCSASQVSPCRRTYLYDTEKRHEEAVYRHILKTIV